MKAIRETIFRVHREEILPANNFPAKNYPLEIVREPDGTMQWMEWELEADLECYISITDLCDLQSYTVYAT